MRDYTAFFAAAVRQSADYSAEFVQNMLNAFDTVLCTDEIDCIDENFLFIYCYDGRTPHTFYGYLSMHYPAALLTADCPALVKEILTEEHVLYTDLTEPMSCDADILRKFAPQRPMSFPVFNEDALLAGDISPDDERFLLVLSRLETGHKSYVDAGEFYLREINR